MFFQNLWKIIETFLKQSTKEGDIVLDPFMGTGSTAVACKEMGRNYFGFEIDKERFEIANLRIDGNYGISLEVDE